MTVKNPYWIFDSSPFFIYCDRWCQILVSLDDQSWHGPIFSLELHKNNSNKHQSAILYKRNQFSIKKSRSTDYKAHVWYKGHEYEKVVEAAYGLSSSSSSLFSSAFALLVLRFSRSNWISWQIPIYNNIPVNGWVLFGQ